MSTSSPSQTLRAAVRAESCGTSRRPAGWRCACCRPPRCWGPVSAASASTAGSVGRLGLLLLGSIALTAHVFVFNDWAGYSSDTRDPRRASLGADGYGISRDQIARVAIALLIVASVAFAVVGTPAMLFGAAIAALSLLYSFSPSLGKSTPIAASLNHLIGGALHFLLGYTLVRAVDARGVALSLFFGLVFAAGHLNQEVRDYEFDLANGIRTSAVAFGCRRGFLASFCLFTAAYLLIVGLAALGVLPKILLLSAVVVAGARAMVASGAAAWPGVRDGAVDAAPVPVALRVGRSRDARPMSTTPAAEAGCHAASFARCTCSSSATR